MVSEMLELDFLDHTENLQCKYEWAHQRLLTPGSALQPLTKE